MPKDLQGLLKRTICLTKNIGLVLEKAKFEKKRKSGCDCARRTTVSVRGMTNPQLSKSLLLNIQRQRPRECWTKTYEFLPNRLDSIDLSFYGSRLEQILRFFGSTVLPAAKDASPNQFYDARIIDKLKKCRGSSVSNEIGGTFAAFLEELCESRAGRYGEPWLRASDEAVQ